MAKVYRKVTRYIQSQQRRISYTWWEKQSLETRREKKKK